MGKERLCWNGVRCHPHSSGEVMESFKPPVTPGGLAGVMVVTYKGGGGSSLILVTDVSTCPLEKAARGVSPFNKAKWLSVLQ